MKNIFLTESPYQDFFRKKLAKYKVKSPKEITDKEKRKEFFSEVKTDWAKEKDSK